MINNIEITLVATRIYSRFIDSHLYLAIALITFEMTLLFLCFYYIIEINVIYHENGYPIDMMS